MAENQAVPPWMNAAMKFVLQSPLHGMVSSKIMLVTFTGRKSGKTYMTPVSYVQQGDAVAMFTRSRWWQNLANGAPVTLHLRGRKVRTSADLITDDVEQIMPILTEHLRHNKVDARIYGVTYDEAGEPKADEVRRAADRVRMLRFKVI